MCLFRNFRIPFTELFFEVSVLLAFGNPTPLGYIPDVEID